MVKNSEAAVASCPIGLSVPNGLVFYKYAIGRDGKKHPIEAYYKCNRGLIVVGNEKKTCRMEEFAGGEFTYSLGKSGQWDGRPPTCKIN